MEVTRRGVGAFIRGRLRMPKLVAAIAASAYTAGLLMGCGQETAGQGVAVTQTEKILCGGRLFGRSACSTDFWKIESDAPQLDGNTIVVTGYLAIDSHMLVLYASELDYQIHRDGLSLLIRFPAIEQKRIVDEFGYSYVTIAAKYDRNEATSVRGGRLGALLGPYEIRGVDMRTSRPGSSELRFHVEDLRSQSSPSR
jgi:hypothetical protein